MDHVNLDQQEAIRKQVAALLILKRLEHAHAHYNAAIQFLNPPDTNTQGAAKRDPEADAACHGFIVEYFKLAKANAIDLTAQATHDAMEHSIRMGQAAAAQPSG